MNPTANHAPDTAGLGIVFGIMIICMYFAPTLIATLRKHHNAGAVFAVNLLLGWTFIGWIIAFIWSLTSPPAPQTIIIHQQPPPPSSPVA